MSVKLLGALTLGVSLVSVLTYMVALGQLLSGPRREGLVRTAACRLAAALLYVGVGLLTLHTNAEGPLVGLGVLTAVQVMWQSNAVADVRLARRSRRNEMSDPFGGVTDPVPNYAAPLPAEVVSAEIDRLSGELITVKQDLKTLDEQRIAANDVRRYGLGAVAFSLVLGITGLIFGMVVFNRADSAVTQSQQNAAIIQQLKDTQLRLTKSVAGQCSLYSLLIGTYNMKSRGVYVNGGPAGYDYAFHQMLAAADGDNCGISAPKDLPK